ncbi:LysR family transcriptional regulator [Myceligenerans indicum]|uniref:LysR family transcriptional regulator n=1 Tax=Myceligenerans indicum TaxID=2593663 RepID=A0ABS1LS27_9MICO|nr:LysR family transcriptional regulator [Myceligenerans indicum]MBL0888588.1 LysR family transcriptional regulator [Myceligenerans indicum]
MNLEHLRTAVSLARHGTVNRTAAADGLAPSSVSDRIRRVESELGAPLFTRAVTGMRPTPAGTTYLAAVENALAELDRAAGALVTAARTVTVGAQASIADTVLPGVLADLSARLPGLVVQVRPEGDRDLLLAALRREEVQAAVLLDAGPGLGDLGYRASDQGLEFLDLREVEMVTVAAPDSPLTGRPVSPSEIRQGATLVGREPRCSFWMASRRWLGDTVRIAAAGGLAQVREWVATGRGVAVLPEFAVRSDLASGRLRAVDAPTPPLQLRLLWRASAAESAPVRSVLYALSQA